MTVTNCPIHKRWSSLRLNPEPVRKVDETHREVIRLMTVLIIFDVKGEASQSDFLKFIIRKKCIQPETLYYAKKDMMERNKDQGENFPCKGARKIEFLGYNEGFTCGIQPDTEEILAATNITLKAYDEYGFIQQTNGPTSTGHLLSQPLEGGSGSKHDKDTQHLDKDNASTVLTEHGHVSSNKLSTKGSLLGVCPASSHFLRRSNCSKFHYCSGTRCIAQSKFSPVYSLLITMYRRTEVRRGGLSRESYEVVFSSLGAFVLRGQERTGKIIFLPHSSPQFRTVVYSSPAEDDSARTFFSHRFHGFLSCSFFPHFDLFPPSPPPPPRFPIRYPLADLSFGARWNGVGNKLLLPSANLVPNGDRCGSMPMIVALVGTLRKCKAGIWSLYTSQRQLQIRRVYDMKRDKLANSLENQLRLRNPRGLYVSALPIATQLLPVTAQQPRRNCAIRTNEMLKKGRGRISLNNGEKEKENTPAINVAMSIILHLLMITLHLLIAHTQWSFTGTNGHSRILIPLVIVLAAVRQSVTICNESIRMEFKLKHRRTITPRANYARGEEILPRDINWGLEFKSASAAANTILDTTAIKSIQDQVSYTHSCANVIREEDFTSVLRDWLQDLSEIKPINSDARRGCSSNAHNQRASVLFLALLLSAYRN
ncbi:hypothetical protein EAG_09628 [Camponotus floridanus]|uniref:Uncharacterized protein n=1 Tax=Camponotus floridanus TaxID=104421 RepID=E2AS72_CAMFO|nr:hypothetical protein EAG_09628 [Camponotus floridanus]